MEVEIIWPPLQTDPNSQKHLTENYLPKHMSKVPSTNESKAKRQNTFPDTKLEKKTPKNYQNKPVHDSDQVTSTQR